jgi:hypothetical protein
MRSVSIFPAAAFVLLVAGCAYRVTPPAGIIDPVTVYIADYGYHASLLLPRENAGVAEFAFGEWDWFVENRTQWYRAVPVIFGRRPGAIGTRTLAIEPTPEALAGAFPPGVTLHPVPVSHAAEKRLLESLDRHFKANETRQSFNPLVGLDFVPDPRPYSATFHCNTAVADWLRRMGCTVTKGGLIADFHVEPMRWRRAGPAAATDERKK